MADIGEVVNDVKCVKGLHFPERVYWWEFPPPVDSCSDYFAHCSICKTDYKLKYDVVVSDGVLR